MYLEKCLHYSIGIATEQSFRYIELIDVKIWISKNASLCRVLANRVTILVKFLRSADVTSILFEKSNLASPFSIKTDMTVEEKTIERLLLKERWELLQKGMDRNQIKICQNNLYINDKLHARILDAKLHTLSSTRHHSTTIDALRSRSIK